jgi:hypothetical protein
MIRVPALIGIAVAATMGIFIAACSSNDTTTNPTSTEFVAKDADFAGFTSWTQTITPRMGPDPAGLLNGGAHSGNDTSLTRTIFINNASAARDANGQFPNGTILVKQLKMRDGTVPVITAMVKRGGEFNKNNKGWEWMLIDPASGKISMRSDTLLSGLCNGCHSANADKDYVFTR